MILDSEAKQENPALSPTTPGRPSHKSVRPIDLLAGEIESVLAPLGYELVHIELVQGSPRTLRVFIDFLSNQSLPTGEDASGKEQLDHDSVSPTLDLSQIKRISLDDCVAVNRALDDLLETTPHIEGAYQLEVSSPGVERPLKKSKDFIRFKGQHVRVGTFAPLTPQQLENPEYAQKNPKQKNFAGILLDFIAEPAALILSIQKQVVRIPLDAVSKAHLEYIEPQEGKRK